MTRLDIFAIVNVYDLEIFTMIRLKPVVKHMSVLACLSLSAVTVWAQDPSTRLQTRALAATCATCHGTDGRAVEGSSVVALAAMPKATMVAQLKAFKDGSRPATVMHQLTKGYTDAQIDSLSTYFAALQR
jgi:cytochrome subunit of sulfide dehydrogenase